MAQKGKIRELQEDLKMSRQAVAGLSKYCDKYKEDIKELKCKVKNLTIQNISKRSELLIGLLTMLEKDGGNEFIDKAEIVAKYEAKESFAIPSVVRQSEQLCEVCNENKAKVTYNICRPCEDTINKV